MRIVCFGPGPKFKGGISNYNTSLAKAFDKIDGVETHIVSWTNQYPSIFPRDTVDRTSKTDLLEDTNIQIKYITDYNKPSTWKQTAQYIVSLQPQMVIFQWSIALQGLPVSRVAKYIKKYSDIEVIFDLHFVVQKEGSSVDGYFSRMALQYADTYITHAYKTVDELKALFPNKAFDVNETGVRSKAQATVIKLYHPIYDLFKPDPAFNRDAFKQEHGLKEHVFLFFGFIRKYKGLHHAIRAFKKVSDQRDDVSMLICGESFWHTLKQDSFVTKVKETLFGLASKVLRKGAEDEKNYRPLALLDELDLRDKVMLVNKFVPNEEVPQYFQVSDAVVLFYEYATPSGIESLSYNFKKPLIATNVGHFPETIVHGDNGYLAEAENVDSMAEMMNLYIQNPIDPENVAKKTADMSWSNYANAILNR